LLRRGGKGWKFQDAGAGDAGQRQQNAPSVGFDHVTISISKKE
jgi:hypothetical protein